MENAKGNNGLMEVYSMHKTTQSISGVHMEFITEIFNSSPEKLRKLAADQQVIEILGKDDAKKLAELLLMIAEEKENAAASAANTDNGNTENGKVAQISASYNIKQNGGNQYEKF